MPVESIAYLFMSVFALLCLFLVSFRPLNVAHVVFFPFVVLIQVKVGKGADQVAK